MSELKGEDLIPGLTLAEIEKSSMPLPSRDELDEEELAIFDELFARSKRFLNRFRRMQDRNTGSPLTSKDCCKAPA